MAVLGTLPLALGAGPGEGGLWGWRSMATRSAAEQSWKASATVPCLSVLWAEFWEQAQSEL